MFFSFHSLNKQDPCIFLMANYSKISNNRFNNFPLFLCKFRHNAEPDVSLRYSAQGVESSSISIDRPDARTSPQPSTSENPREPETSRPVRTPQQIQLQQSLAAANLVSESPSLPGAPMGSSWTPATPRVADPVTPTTPPPSGINESERDYSGVSLPGPRQLTTNPGNPGTNPRTGQRQRRIGVSGPPSGLYILIVCIF